MAKKLQEGIDYYVDEQTGYRVFTALYLSRRAFCCGNKCKHCPFDPKWKRGTEKIKEKEN